MIWGEGALLLWGERGRERRKGKREYWEERREEAPLGYKINIKIK